MFGAGLLGFSFVSGPARLQFTTMLLVCMHLLQRFVFFCLPSVDFRVNGLLIRCWLDWLQAVVHMTTVCCYQRSPCQAHGSLGTPVKLPSANSPSISSPLTRKSTRFVILAPPDPAFVTAFYCVAAGVLPQEEGAAVAEGSGAGGQDGFRVRFCLVVWLSGSVAALFECPRVCCCHSNAYDYTVKIGDMLGGRYRVIESLGKVRFVCDVRLVFVVRGFTCT
jgi:hypothetical protein